MRQVEAREATVGERAPSGHALLPTTEATKFTGSVRNGISPWSSSTQFENLVSY